MHFENNQWHSQREIWQFLTNWWPIRILKIHEFERFWTKIILSAFWNHSIINFLATFKKEWTFSLKIMSFWWNRIASVVGYFSKNIKNMVLRLISAQNVHENQLKCSSNRSKWWVLGAGSHLDFLCVNNVLKVGVVVKGKWNFFVWSGDFFLSFWRKNTTFSFKIYGFWWNRIASILGYFLLKYKKIVLQFISVQNGHTNPHKCWPNRSESLVLGTASDVNFCVLQV